MARLDRCIHQHREEGDSILIDEIIIIIMQLSPHMHVDIIRCLFDQEINRKDET